MPVIHPLFRSHEISISRGVNRNRVRIPYKILLEQGIDYTNVDELKTPAKLHDIYFGILAQPMEGDCPVNGMESAALVNVEIRPRRLDVAIVVATYASDVSFGSAFRPRSRSNTVMGRFKRPQYTEVASVGGPAYVFHQVEYSRASTILVKPFVTAGWTDGDSAAEQAQVNHYFSFGGIPYLYAGADVTSLGNGQTIIEYKFWTVGPMHAIPAGAIVGDDIDLPSLGFLDEWVANPAGPTIERVDFDTVYGQGGALPHSNIHGGG